MYNKKVIFLVFILILFLISICIGFIDKPVSQFFEEEKIIENSKNQLIKNAEFDLEETYISDIYVHGNYIYLSKGQIFTFDGENFSKVAQIEGVIGNGIFVDDKYIYIANKYKGLEIFTFDGKEVDKVVSDDANTIIEPGKYAYQFAEDVFVDDKYIYLANGIGGLRIYTFDGKNLTNIAQFNYGNIVDVFVDNGYIYLVNGALGVYTFDGKNLTNIAQFNDGGVNKIYIEGDYIYSIGGDELRAYTFDGKNLTNRAVAKIFTDHNKLLTGLYVSDNYIYTVNGYNGLRAFTFDYYNYKFEDVSGDQEEFKGYARGPVYSDGKYIYLTTDYSLKAYSHVFKEGVKNNSSIFILSQMNESEIDSFKMNEFIEENKGGMTHQEALEFFEAVEIVNNNLPESISFLTDKECPYIGMDNEYETKKDYIVSECTKNEDTNMQVISLTKCADQWCMTPDRFVLEKASFDNSDYLDEVTGKYDLKEFSNDSYDSYKWLAGFVKDVSKVFNSDEEIKKLLAINGNTRAANGFFRGKLDSSNDKEYIMIFIDSNYVFIMNDDLEYKTYNVRTDDYFPIQMIEVNGDYFFITKRIYIGSITTCASAKEESFLCNLHDMNFICYPMDSFILEGCTNYEGRTNILSDDVDHDGENEIIAQKAIYADDININGRKVYPQKNYLYNIYKWNKKDLTLKRLNEDIIRGDYYKTSEGKALLKEKQEEVIKNEFKIFNITELVKDNLPEEIEFWTEANCPYSNLGYKYIIPKGYKLRSCVRGETGSHNGCPTCEMSKILLERLY